MLHLQPRDPVTSFVVNRYYGSGLNRIPGSNILWRARLINAFNVSIDLAGGSFGIGGEGRSTYGAITIAIGDEVERNYVLRDSFAWLDWYHRPITLYLGGDPKNGWEWDDYIIVFQGLSDEITRDEDRLTVIVRDPSIDLDQPLQTNLYAGTGGYEGSEEIKNQEKPLAFGQLFNISCICIDRFKLIYQVNDGPVKAISKTYDKGDAYIFD